MAFSDNKITSADLTGKGVTGMADTPNLTTAQMQQKLDEVGKDVIVPKFNALCDDLDATDFASIITSKSTDKMLFQRLNEYDQIEYSVDNVNWFLVASGKEILDPSIEADNSKKLGGQLPAYYQKTTDSALNTTSKTTTGAINEINTALSNVDTTANEAPAYSASSTYVVGDYVSYQKHIYKCTTAITTAEAWNATHWTQVTLGDELESVNNSLVVNGTTFYFDIQNGVKGMNTDQNRGADTFTPFNLREAKVITTDINDGNLIPVMTSNTEPSGIASASDSSVKQPYTAFNRVIPNATTGAGYWYSSTTNAWLAYGFNELKTIHFISLQFSSTSVGIITVQYKSGTSWIDIIQFDISNTNGSFFNKMITTGTIITNEIRFVSTSNAIAIGYVKCC